MLSNTVRAFRYLDSRFVDDFFSSGRLRLSSFRQFSRHADEERLDTEEGSARLSIVGRKPNSGFVQTVVSIPHAYVLSTSSRRDESLLATFGVDSCFCIEDSFAFGTAIARYLPAVYHCLVGPCLYVENRSIAHVEDDVLSLLRAPDGKWRADQLMRWTEEIGMPRMLFMKPLRFTAQEEYRFVWLSSEATSETVEIVCPEAVALCSRVTFP